MTTRVVDNSLMHLQFRHVTNGQSFVVDKFDENNYYSYHVTWSNTFGDNERWYSESHLKSFINSYWIIEKIEIVEDTFEIPSDIN